MKRTLLANRPARPTAATAGAPTLREVCLLAAARPSQAWSPGEQVAWSGRHYRVIATQDPDSDGEILGYVHLRTC